MIHIVVYRESESQSITAIVTRLVSF